MTDIDTDAVEKSEAARREEEVLTFWKENHIFEKSLERGSDKDTFVFYEGPPTANGRPGVHHMESRSFKDVIPRYKTMRGFRTPRRAGWDTHGLPVELEVEKQLGFSGKKDIETYGIAAFNKKCRESVFSYIDLWQRFTERMGYWVDQGKAYFTFEPKYMESVWSIVKKVSDDGLLYKDYRVVPWCPVCGTGLSSHELAQGYEEVKDLSLTVKFELEGHPGTYFLAWTTTPWTLPGNIALAVGRDIEYVQVKTDEGNFILAKERVETVFGGTPYEIVDTKKGSECVGATYKPLYDFATALAPEGEQSKFDKAYQVYAADFVNTEDGTGIVHTAVMYGQDDFELGQKLGLPKVHLVAPDGKFIAGTGFLEGASVIDAETNVAILKDLQERHLFFSKENYTHQYPHCWRSKNRLIYYARDSWYIEMTKLKDELVKQNQTVNWEPSYIRDGRMGEWLENVRDWAISRERYWGTPLPVWRSDDGSEQVVIGSVEELKARTKKSGNRYFMMRHGEAVNNAEGFVNAHIEEKCALTDAGKKQVEKSAKELTSTGITKIYASPFMRARETAEIMAEHLGLDASAIVVDERLREVDFGSLDGGAYDEFLTYEKEHVATYDTRLPEGESYLEAKRRFGAFLYEVEHTKRGETVLIVSHGIALETLAAVAEGADMQRSKEILDTLAPQLAQVIELPFVPLPHNDNYELDLHRPYIDELVLMGDSGRELGRTPEVMDVWLDSGAMPFAQDHYPFENKDWLDTKGFPADYISEAIDQTRGWFYTLLAVGVLMGKGVAYRNVICLGHLLDDKGQKMSKSKGNIIEPMAAMDRYGADTLRLWMYSVNQPGDNKNFDDKTVKEAARVLSWFENSVKFYELFCGQGNGKGKEEAIDLWMRSRMNETIARATEALDAYDLYTGAKTIAALVEDLSQWYVRRVRDRVREGDSAAITTLHDALQTIAVLLAPFTPFIAEWAYQIVRTEDDPESVHLADWYEAGTVDDELNAAMRVVRGFASEALRERQVKGIKVRQPLASLTIPEELPKELAALLAEEVNVKEILTGAFAIDAELTPELVAEGDERAFARAVAEARKSEDYAPLDTVRVEKEEKGKYEAELSTGTVRFSLYPDAA